MMHAECQTRQEHQKREETRKRLVLGINKLVRRQHRGIESGENKNPEITLKRRPGILYFVLFVEYFPFPLSSKRKWRSGLSVIK